MMSSPLKELHRFGVSVWYDNISRELLSSGELARLIDDGVRGVTSNPTIFEKAIGGSTAYDEAIAREAKKGKSPAEIFEAIAVEDIRAAADLFNPLYDETRGADGFVSIELAPNLAHDAQLSHTEALRLHKLVGRANVMIKIPGTKAGLQAFEDATADGIPVNVTLLFSQERYAAVAEAYLQGLERRAAHHKDLSRVASVASFFVSRVDSSLDKRLEKIGTPQALALRGKAAVANAKLAYQTYKKIFGSKRFAALKKLGAQPQRLLWASTGTKNPAYSDVLYVEELIGEPTVNTMPPATVDAFKDHGRCRPSMEEDVDAARAAWEQISDLTEVDAVMRELEEEGVRSFAKSFETLMGGIAAKKEIVQAEGGIVESGLEELRRAMFVSRLWDRDASLWKDEKEHQKIIKNSLGWLTAAESMSLSLGQVRQFASEVKSEGFAHAVVLGMGGSSLCCEVFRCCFPAAKGHPKLEILDTTNPDAIAALEKRLELKRTLFIVSSKSGSTIEPNCFMDYFYGKVEKLAGAKAGRQFAAITDPGTSLEDLARRRGFRRVFTNPSDIGGRYSALTLFGLVPAAVMGIDVELLLSRAREAMRQLSPAAETAQNPGLRLGAALGRHALKGQDKLTLSLSPSIDAFGLWIEQLVAESTGKEGKGIVPVPSGALSPGRYAGDRLFVRLELPNSPDKGAVGALAALERAGHPVITLPLRDAYDLGAQFLIWEVATAAAGLLLGINPFDQPDVQSAKNQTNSLLSSLKKGRLPSEKAPLRAGGWAAFGDDGLIKALTGKSAEKTPDLPLEEVLAAHLARLKSGDYCALLAYVDPGEESQLALDTLQTALRQLGDFPVCEEFGPRYLHSSGQLHKGGRNSGLFLMLTAPVAEPLPIPGREFDFGTLHRAQALGDYAALKAAGRRVLRLELGPAGSQPWKALRNALATLAEKRNCRA
ncbi:MAG: bifunctional transaldolase/phosoglucose isomerase [Elusimicrobia bacterium]|nr:bifunctional transaldolase/phosoglucose isomerase [Elusimicrobiota bacterium]